MESVEKKEMRNGMSPGLCFSPTKEDMYPPAALSTRGREARGDREMLEQTHKTYRNLTRVSIKLRKGEEWKS